MLARGEPAALWTRLPCPAIPGCPSPGCSALELLLLWARGCAGGDGGAGEGHGQPLASAREDEGLSHGKWHRDVLGDKRGLEIWGF